MTVSILWCCFGPLGRHGSTKPDTVVRTEAAVALRALFSRLRHLPAYSVQRAVGGKALHGSGQPTLPGARMLVMINRTHRGRDPRMRELGRTASARRWGGATQPTSPALGGNLESIRCFYCRRALERLCTRCGHARRLAG